MCVGGGGCSSSASPGAQGNRSHTLWCTELPPLDSAPNMMLEMEFGSAMCQQVPSLLCCNSTAHTGSNPGSKDCCGSCLSPHDGPFPPSWQEENYIPTVGPQRCAPEKESGTPVLPEKGHSSQQPCSLASSPIQDVWNILDLGSSPSDFASQHDSAPGRWVSHIGCPLSWGYKPTPSYRDTGLQCASGCHRQYLLLMSVQPEARLGALGSCSFAHCGNRLSPPCVPGPEGLSTHCPARP